MVPSLASARATESLATLSFVKDRVSGMGWCRQVPVGVVRLAVAACQSSTHEENVLVSDIVKIAYPDLSEPYQARVFEALCYLTHQQAQLHRHFRHSDEVAKSPNSIWLGSQAVPARGMPARFDYWTLCRWVADYSVAGFVAQSRITLRQITGRDVKEIGTVGQEAHQLLEATYG